MFRGMPIPKNPTAATNNSPPGVFLSYERGGRGTPTVSVIAGLSYHVLPFLWPEKGETEGIELLGRRSREGHFAVRYSAVHDIHAYRTDSASSVWSISARTGSLSNVFGKTAMGPLPPVSSLE